jgi:hypothetical protein
MNILIKLMSVVSLVLAPWFVRVWGIDTEAGPPATALLDTLRGMLFAFFG